MAVELRILTDEATNTGFVLDLKPGTNFPLALSFQMAALTDIAKTKASFSKTFRVPETKENNKNLNAIYYSSTGANNDVKNLNRCIIVEDGVPLQKGWVRVKNVVETQEGREYEMLFFGNNYAWIKGFRDINIRDLDFSSDDHTFDSATVQASWGSIGTPANSDDRSYVYPVINYGKYNAGNEVTFEDLRPAVFIRSVLDKAFDVALGSTVEKYNIESTFLDSTYFKRLIMPFSTGEFKSTEIKDTGEDLLAEQTTPKTTSRFTNVDGRVGQREALRATTLVSGNSSSSPEYYAYYSALDNDDNGLYLSAGNYEIEIQVTATMRTWAVDNSIGQAWQSDPLNMWLRFVDENNNVYQRKALNFLDKAKEENSYNNVELTLSENFNINVSADFYTKYFFDFFVTYPNYNVNTDIQYNNVEIKVYKQDQVLNGGTVKVAETLPDVKAIDLFKGVQHAFNLYVDTNEWTRSVKIEPRDSFYASTASAIDWTSKLDLSGGFNIQYLDNYSRSIRLEYAEDSQDAFTRAYEESEETKLGAGEIDLDDRFPQGETAFINPFFAPTIHSRSNIGRRGTAEGLLHKKPLLPTMWNALGTMQEPPLATHSFGPRMLFYNYAPQLDRNSDDITWYFDGGVLTDLPTGYFTDTVEGVSLNQESLHFEDKLMPNYYSGLIGLLNEGVTITARFNLNREDIQQLDLSIPIHISAPTQIAGYYTIESIVDYIPGATKSTKVKLAKVLNTNTISPKAKYKAAAEALGSGNEKHRGDLFKDKDRNAFEQASNEETIKKFDEYNNRFGSNWNSFEEDQTTAYNWRLGSSPKNDLESYTLNNGSGSFAAAGRGAIAAGKGVVAIGEAQAAFGSYNAISHDDIFSIGSGTSDTNRQTAWSIDKNGNPQTHGGNVYMQDSNGNLIEVMTVVDNRYEKVYLSKETNG